MADKNEIKVLSCTVKYDEKDEERTNPLLKDCKILIKGVTRKMLGAKAIAEKTIEWTADFEGVSLKEALELVGPTLRIKMQTIRDRDDFVETAEKLNGSTVKYTEIDDWTNKGGQRLPLLGKWLLGLERNGKKMFSAEQVKAILEDPTRRAKAQAQFDEIMKNAPEMEF